MSSLIILLVIFNLFLGTIAVDTNTQPFEVEELSAPINCKNVARAGDHVLIDYELRFDDKVISSNEQIGSYFHIQLQETDLTPVQTALRGVCEKSSRVIHFASAKGLDTAPLFTTSESLIEMAENAKSIDLHIHVQSVTTSTDYQIFDLLSSERVGDVLELISNHTGINAIDEHSTTPLMHAIYHRIDPIIGALLNTRMPSADVNIAKKSGHTALIYAIDLLNPSFVSALLRRGANPNVVINSGSRKGFTPLHFACLFEKPRVAQLLLDYNADPFAVNDNDETPLDVLPQTASSSQKILFLKMFEEAAAKIEAAEEAAEAAAHAEL